MDTQQIIGKKIKDARQRIGISQEELGSRVGYSAMGISHFECGVRKIKIEELEKIARALDVGINYFLDSTISSVGSSQIGNVSYFRSKFDNFDENKRKEISGATSKFEEYVKSLHENKNKQ
jgi:transcriptional regulator with XRE-family HTH domain